MTNMPLLTVLAIDPGNNMGLSVCRIDFNARTITVLFTHTLVIDKVIRYDSHDVQLSATKEARRARYLEPILTQILEQWNVDAVIYESAYSSKSLIAYEALKFYGEVIRHCAQSYYWDILLQTVAPSKVKKVLGVKGNSGDKDLMTQAVFNHPAIKFADNVDINAMTEHAIDSVAIGYFMLHDFIGE